MWNPLQITAIGLFLLTAVWGVLPCAAQESVELKPPIEKGQADIPSHVESNVKLQEPFPAHTDTSAPHDTDGRPLLRGAAEAASVNGHARLLATTPLTHHRDRSVHFIELNIKNISDQVVVVDANQAEVRVNG
ncbi:MAG TPA: hypothetical protein PLC15_24435, partial [Candidatus Obscuribacter sp.]|nr:hypothetical protein [Candidatus Obscuribacter sp.]